MQDIFARADQLGKDSTGSVSPLPEYVTSGLTTVVVFSALSFFSSFGLFSYLTYRFIRVKFVDKSKEPLNQFLVLTYNLLLADLQQAVAFGLNIVWLTRNSIQVGTTACWLQAWLINTGDLSSSLFIFAIALHTLLVIVNNYKLPQWGFWLSIVGLWTFNYVVTCVPMIGRERLYVRSGPWCWISTKHQAVRLWSHYLWIYIIIVLVVIIYATICLVLLRRQRDTTPATRSPHALAILVLYPTIFVFCSLPLALARLMVMTGWADISLEFLMICGAIIACNGWLDVLIYTWTRREVIFGEPTDQDMGFDTFVLANRRGMGIVTTVEGGLQMKDADGGEKRMRGGRTESSSSTERFLDPASLKSGGDGAGGILYERTVEVKVERRGFRPRTMLPNAMRSVGGERGGDQSLGSNIKLELVNWGAEQPKSPDMRSVSPVSSLGTS